MTADLPASADGGCRSQIIIPARLESTRLPRKLLLRETGKTVLQHTYEAAGRARKPRGRCVAADHEELAEEVRRFGGQVFMTDPAAASGTDRIAEVARQMPDLEIVVNVQGDEPMMAHEVLSDLIKNMRKTGADMGTAAVPFSISGRSPEDPNAVKVVCDSRGFALYFSRSLIPFPRNGGQKVEPLLHWGLYAYTRKFLQQFVNWPQGMLENCEMLEQLRALENGARIWVLVTQHRSVGVDVPEDITLVEKLLQE